MTLLLCYDVCEDARRTRLFKKLKGFLVPVQKSVFEGELPTRRWDELLKMVHQTIDLETDSVRIYHLCRGCAGITTLVGTSPPVRDPAEPVII